MKTALVCFLLVACRNPTASTGAPDASAATTTSCAATVASYDSLVASGGACATDADCACFNGGVSQKTPCGGVSDRTTAASLEKLITDYEHGHCDALMCAATMCTPACRSGKCANGAGAPAVTASAASSTPPPPPAGSSWTSCKSDADCTYVSLGCCDTTPVNRAHVADAKQKLERSGHMPCPVKTACGPATNGTWEGAAGKCTAGNCTTRPW